MIQVSYLGLIKHYNIILILMESKNQGPALQKSMTRALFIESLIGNIKEKYFFEKKLGSGGYGAVYLAKNKGTGKLRSVLKKRRAKITK